MYVNPFWFGFVLGAVACTVVIFGVAVISNRKR